MATLIIIKKAILDMKDRTGSSLPALKKWLETNEKVRRRIRVVSSGCKSFLRPFSGSVNFVFRKKKKTTHKLTWYEKIKWPYHRLHLELDNETYIY